MGRTQPPAFRCADRPGVDDDFGQFVSSDFARPRLLCQDGVGWLSDGGAGRRRTFCLWTRRVNPKQ